jgi:hypothetical protein
MPETLIGIETVGRKLGGEGCRCDRMPETLIGIETND